MPCCLWHRLRLLLQVAGQPDLQEVTTSTSWINAVKSSIADDIIAMVTAYEQVSIDVAMALGEFNRDVLVAVSKLLLVNFYLDWLW